MRIHALISVLIIASAGCSNGGGSTNAGECESGATQCAGNTFQSCEDGAWVNTDQCLGLCDNGLGCVDCTPATNFCVGNDVHACDDAGNDTGATESCGDLFCSGGQCRDLCADAVESQSYIGCEYMAVDLDNAIEVGGRPTEFLGQKICDIPLPGFPGSGQVAKTLDVCVETAAPADGLIAGTCDPGGTCPADYTCTTEEICVLDAQGSPFAVVVANPQAVDMDITIENGAGQSMAILVPSGEVMAIYPGDLGFTNPQIDGTVQSLSAYKLSARGPFVAYQFNPLDNENVFSNDGSLLLPVHTWDARYYAMSLPSLTRRPATNDYNAYLTVVGHADGTEITVTPTTDIRAGETLPAIAAGTPTTFTLNAYDVINLEAIGDGDLTGTLVEATDPATSYGMFAGHEAVVIGQQCCADHLEEMMFPASTWGTSYAIARSKQRGSESDLVRIIAQQDGTTVTLSSGTCPTLNAGQVCELQIAGNLEVTADKPIMVGQFLSSEGGEPVSQLGDPSMAIAVPTEQYRSQYSFLVPMEYTEQYVSIVTPASGSVFVDGDDVSAQLTSMGSGTYKAGWVQVQPGQHEISCPDKCGIVVYGYSDAVSYMFAGGLDLERIVVD